MTFVDLKFRLAVILRLEWRDSAIMTMAIIGLKADFLGLTETFANDHGEVRLL